MTKSSGHSKDCLKNIQFKNYLLNEKKKKPHSCLMWHTGKNIHWREGYFFFSYLHSIVINYLPICLPHYLKKQKTYLVILNFGCTLESPWKHLKIIMPELVGLEDEAWILILFQRSHWDSDVKLGLRITGVEYFSH